VVGNMNIWADSVKACIDKHSRKAFTSLIVSDGVG